MSDGNGNDPDATGANSLNAIVAALKDGFQELVKEALTGAQGDVKAYAVILAQEYGRDLWRQYRDGDKVAAENLRDLKAQVALIAVKRELIVTREAIERIKQIVEDALAIGARVLIAAAVAAL